MALLWALVVDIPVYGQLTLAPTFVYMDAPKRHSALVISNSSNSAKEVFIDFRFGYPGADSLGERYVEYEDTSAEANHSLTPWIEAFPRRFRIEPGHRQIVRLMVDPPSAFQEGIYWTRLVVTSNDEPDAHAATAKALDAQVHLSVRQIIPVVFANGELSTGARIHDLKYTADAAHIHFLTTFGREGASPFFGSAELRILDKSGKAVREIRTSAEAYYEASTRFSLASSDLKPGKYTAEVTLRAKRSDVGRSRLPHMEPVSRRFEIEVPATGMTANR